MSILSRYILGHFVRPLATTTTGFVVILVVVDLANRMSSFLDQEAPAGMMATYYAWSVPYFAFVSLPMAMLLATMFCVGGLARRNELSAMKAAGVSLYRILLPVQGMALLVSFAAYVASAELIPHANGRRAGIASGAGPVRGHIPRAQVVLRDVDGQVLSLGEYRPDERRGRRVTLDRYDNGKLRESVRADTLVWADGWVFRRGEVRRFSSRPLPAPSRGTGERGSKGGGPHSEQRGEALREDLVAFDSLRVSELTLSPDDLSRESRPVEELSSRELADLIARKVRSGGDATRETVEANLRVAFSFSSFVVVLFGFPLSSRARHSGRPLLVGLCLLVSFVFYGCLQAGRAMGWNGLLDPLAAAWGPNVLFLAVGGVMLARAHK